MKKFLISLMLVMFVLQAGFSDRYPDGENSKAWNLLEMAKLAYENEELGEAMLYAGRAYDIHTAEYTEIYNYLYEALKSKQVKIVGDRISDVYEILFQREDKIACDFLKQIFLTHPPKFFNKSMKNLMTWLKEKKDAFPEVYYLKGLVFQAEGEFSQAMLYYKKAWDDRKFLEIADSKFSIIYSMADISGLMGHIDDKEKYLLLVLTEDSLFGNTAVESKTLAGMINNIHKNKTVDNFFLLYRHDMGICLKAYDDLTEMYLNAQNYERALKTSTASACIAVTLLEKALQQNNFLYQYNDLSDTMKKAGANSDINIWAENLRIWQILLNFADVLYYNGEVSQAKDLYSKLAGFCPLFDVAMSANYKLEVLSKKTN